MFPFKVMEAVHGVTIQEVHFALQRNDWNPIRAEQQLKVWQHKCMVALKVKHYISQY